MKPYPIFKLMWWPANKVNQSLSSAVTISVFARMGLAALQINCPVMNLNSEMVCVLFLSCFGGTVFCVCHLPLPRRHRGEERSPQTWRLLCCWRWEETQTRSVQSDTSTASHLIWPNCFSKNVKTPWFWSSYFLFWFLERFFCFD